MEKERMLAVVDELTTRLAATTTPEQRRAALEVVDALTQIGRDWPAPPPDAGASVCEAYAEVDVWLHRAQVFGRLVRLTDDVHRSDEPRLI